MANELTNKLSKDKNELLSAHKGHNIIVKGIVVAESKDDPLGADRVQVYIPSYHGQKEDAYIYNGESEQSDNNIIASVTSTVMTSSTFFLKWLANKKNRQESGKSGQYPWAQVCTPSFQDDADGIGSFILAAVNSSVAETGSGKPGTFPKKDDVVIIAFEGGDSRKPIVLGNLGAALPEITWGGADTGDGADGSGSGMGLASLLSQILKREETGTYEGVPDVVFNGDGSSSIGYFQWRAARAKNLLIDIKNRDTSSWNSLASSKLKNAVGLPDSSWNNILFTGSDLTALKAVLRSEAGIQCQNELADKESLQHIQEANGLGVTDPAASIFFGDMNNQGPAYAKTIAKSSKGGNLETIYKNAMAHNVMGAMSGRAYAPQAYGGRRTRVRDKIKQWEQDGTLAEALAYDAGGGGEFLWPCPGFTTVSSKFGMRISPTTGNNSMHNGIDIAGGSINGKPIVASHDGTITNAAQLTSTGYGYWASIKSDDGKTETRYAHMIKMGHKSGKVSQGDTIGYVGSTGGSTGPHLHFEIRQNGTPVDPQPLLSASASGSGNRAKLVKIAKAEMNGNRGSKYYTWYGFGYRVEWCACFVSWCLNQAGVISKFGGKFAYCPNGVNAAKSGNYWKGNTGYTPKAGDVIFFWKGSGVSTHVGIVEKCSGGTVYTLEGNSSDMTKERTYSVSNTSRIMGYASPNY